MELRSVVSFGVRNDIVKTIEDQLSSLDHQYYPYYIEKSVDNVFFLFSASLN